MNVYKGKIIEFHILQSFPVTCLNRDDVGAPKTAMIGGVQRARVSSQCWKRQVRLALHDFDIKLAVRTKYIAEKIAFFCQDDTGNLESEKIFQACQAIANIMAKDTLYFFTDEEAKALGELAKENNYDATVLSDSKNETKLRKEITKRQKNAIKTSFKDLEGLDIALFGRMVANAAELNIEAAASFSHAISTHKVSNEIEFFTAVDDDKIENSDTSGSAHMGSLEFNSATYYRYICLDLGQLVQTLGDDIDLNKAVTAFIKALYIAVPSARQKTQTGNNLWDYAQVYVRKGQGIQASFEEPVKSKGNGYLKPSIDALDAFLDKKEKLSGSLFGTIGKFTWGINESYSIDDLITDILSTMRN